MADSAVGSGALLQQAPVVERNGQPPQTVPPLQEGFIQSCEGYLKRRTNVLKRWKKEWLSVQPGKLIRRQYESFKPLI